MKYTFYDLIDELNWWSPIFERWIPNTSNVEITKFKITELINELDEALNYFKITKIKDELINLGVKKIDYVELYNLKTLKRPKNKREKFKIFIAFYLNKIRLIDNI